MLLNGKKKLINLYEDFILQYLVEKLMLTSLALALLQISMENVNDINFEINVSFFISLFNSLFHLICSKFV